MAFVTATTVLSDPWKWWKEHEADFAAGLMLAVLAVAAWWVVRVWRRPRVAGRLYCRRCNYDVTHANGDAAIDRCPECGSPQGTVRPIGGSSRGRRLLPPMIAACAVLGVLGWRLGNGVNVGVPGRTAWPTAALQRIVPGWSLSRREVIAQSAQRIQCFETKTWKLRGIIDKAWESPRTSPRGELLAWVELNLANGWNNDLVLAPTDGGPRRQVRLGDNTSGFGAVIGFTGDQREVLVVMNGLVGPPLGSGETAETSGITRVRLLGVSLESLAVREIGAIQAAAIQNAPNQWSVPTVAAAAEGGESGGWAMLVISGPDAPKLVWGAPGKPPLEQRPPLAVLPGSVFDATFSLVKDAFVIHGPTPSGRHITLQRDGTVEKRRRTDWKWSVQSNNQANPIVVVSGDKSRTIEFDGAPKTFIVQSFWQSPDERFLMTLSVSTVGKPGAELRVFDLWKLIDPSERIEPASTPP
jgi:hypothetical protein